MSASNLPFNLSGQPDALRNKPPHRTMARTLTHTHARMLFKRFSHLAVFILFKNSVKYVTKYIAFRYIFCLLGIYMTQWFAIFKMPPGKDFFIDRDTMQ